MDYNICNLHIFDCDGVLLDSNKAKIEALRNVFISINAPMSFIEWAMKEFQSNFGRTRRQHFDAFMLNSYEHGFKFSSEKCDQALKKYSENVELLYQKCKVINETLLFMLQLSKDEQIFVVSASDQTELRIVLPSKIPVLKKENIFGGPSSKLKNINHVIDMTGSKKAILYGDSVQDAKASMTTGINFLGLKKYSADSEALELFCIDNNLNCINSLSGELSS